MLAASSDALGKLDPHLSTPRTLNAWRKRALLGLTVVATGWALPGMAAQVYQCVAADGSKTYSDAPCSPAARSVNVPVSQQPKRSTSGPDIQRADYVSPRNGRSLDVTMQLRSACERVPGSCVLSCGNHLAGDPDFGQRKYCQIRYRCGDETAHQAQMLEGESTTLTCTSSTEMHPETAVEPQQVPAQAMFANTAGVASGLPAPVAAVVAPPAASAAAASYAWQSAQQNGRSSVGFTDYVLSLYWRPTLCKDSPQADQCRGVGQDGFVLNGLWPHKDSDSPVRCAVNLPVPDSVVQSMADLLPTRALVEHEWSEHGSCTGMDPRQYFRTVRRAYDSMVLPDLSYKGSPLQQRTYDIGRNFQSRDPGLSPISLAITCTSETPPRLQEVRVCLTQELDSKYCAGDMIASRCNSVSVVVPPAH